MAFASRVLNARLAVPFPNKVGQDVYDRNSERQNYIDGLVIAKLKALHIAPSGTADDATFLRRAYLDAAGILPTSEEVEDFLADTRRGQTRKAIEKLMARDEFVDYWAYKWSDLLLVSSRKLRCNGHVGVLRLDPRSVKEDKPWNQFA